MTKNFLLAAALLVALAPAIACKKVPGLTEKITCQDRGHGKFDCVKR